MCEYGDYGNVMGRRDVCDERLLVGYERDRAQIIVVDIFIFFI